jgi:hypothetical protein
MYRWRESSDIDGWSLSQYNPPTLQNIKQRQNWIFIFKKGLGLNLISFFLNFQQLKHQFWRHVIMKSESRMSRWVVHMSRACAIHTHKLLNKSNIFNIYKRTIVRVYFYSLERSENTQQCVSHMCVVDPRWDFYCSIWGLPSSLSRPYNNVVPGPYRTATLPGSGTANKSLNQYIYITSTCRIVYSQPDISLFFFTLLVYIYYTEPWDLRALRL